MFIEAYILLCHRGRTTSLNFSIDFTRKSDVLGAKQDHLRAPIRRRRGPTESFIIYDESSSPGADDPASLLILRRTGAISLLMLRRTGYLIDADYPIETYL